MGKLHLSPVICGSVSQLLLLVALNSNHWVDYGVINVGLWEVCRQNSSGIIVCSMVVEEFVIATQIFLVLAVIAGFIACGLLFYHSEIRSFSVAKSATIASFLAGLLALVAIAIFTGNMGENSFYGWSFFVGWVGGTFFLVTGGLALILNTGAAS